MGVESQLKKIEDLYTSNLRERGVTSLAVGWNTPECQRLRFEKLCHVLGADTRYSVNDYGCGYGAHLLYLTKERNHEIQSYNGYDISAEMLERAREELKSYNGALKLLREKSISTKADYTFVSGTFNVRFDADKAAWEAYIKAVLEQMNTHSERGFSFNLLTSYVDWEEPHLYYGDPCFWFDYCKKNFSKRVALLHDYPLWEWTISVNKAA